MDEETVPDESFWVPAACTLPLAQQPVRAAEWGDLFDAAVLDIRRVTVRSARLELRPDPVVAARAADLAARETQCCSFFTFNQIARGGTLTWRSGSRPSRPPRSTLCWAWHRRRTRRCRDDCPVTTRTGRRGGRGQPGNPALLRTPWPARPPERTLGGHRVYPGEAVTLLRIIKTAQRLGFSLTEVSDLLDVATHRHGQRRSSELRTRAKAKLAEVEQKITDLTAIRDTLREAISGGCVDLLDCANTPSCPLPPISEVFTSDRAAGTVTSPR